MALIEGITPSGKKKGANVTENGDLIVVGQTSTSSSPVQEGAEGTPIAGQSLESGGSKLVGWLSSNRKAVTDFAANFGLITGLASDIALINGSIHAKLRAIASTQYSTWNRLQTAPDLIQTLNYLDVNTSDRRVNTIVYTSASLGLTITETYNYIGSPGSYDISSIARS